jgi:hypothetical protein
MMKKMDGLGKLMMMINGLMFFFDGLYVCFFYLFKSFSHGLPPGFRGGRQRAGQGPRREKNLPMVEHTSHLLM